MGADKSRLLVDGIELRERLAEQLTFAGCEVTILGRESFGSYLFIPDQADYLGPAHALSKYRCITPAAFVASCDLYRFDPRLVPLLLERLNSSKADAVMPTICGSLQPLCAIYRRSAFDVLREVIDSGHRSMFAWLDRVDVQTVSESDLAAAAIDPQSALGVNTPEELEQRARCFEND